MKNLKIKIASPVPEWRNPYYEAAVTGVGAELILVDKDCCPEEFDGLLLPGGYDVEPSRYGQENDGTSLVEEGLDDLQFTVLDKFVKAGKPVLGVCRGHQVVNVYFGGTLIQDLPTSFRHKWSGLTQDNIHPTTAVPGSWIAELYGTHFTTNSSHHQGVDRLGEGLRIDQFSDEDQVPEALSHESLPVYCIQYHPERMSFSRRRPDTVDGRKIFDFFLKVCEEYRTTDR